MKKLISILVLSTVLISCNKEVEQQEQLPDCDCDEVVDFTSNYITQGQYAGVYWTINQCSGLQMQHDWHSYGNNHPVIGDCK